MSVSPPCTSVLERGQQVAGGFHDRSIRERQRGKQGQRPSKSNSADALPGSSLKITPASDLNAGVACPPDDAAAGEEGDEPVEYSVRIVQAISGEGLVIMVGWRRQQDSTANAAQVALLAEPGTSALPGSRGQSHICLPGSPVGSVANRAETRKELSQGGIVTPTRPTRDGHNIARTGSTNPVQHGETTPCTRPPPPPGSSHRPQRQRSGVIDQEVAGQSEPRSGYSEMKECRKSAQQSTREKLEKHRSPSRSNTAAHSASAYYSGYRLSKDASIRNPQTDHKRSHTPKGAVYAANATPFDDAQSEHWHDVCGKHSVFLHLSPPFSLAISRSLSHTHTHVHTRAHTQLPILFLFGTTRSLALALSLAFALALTRAFTIFCTVLSPSPRAEEIGFRMITTVKIATTFQGSPQNVKELFTE